MRGDPEQEAPSLALQETIPCRGSHHADREWAERTVPVAVPLERRGTPAIPSQRFWRARNGPRWHRQRPSDELHKLAGGGPPHGRFTSCVFRLGTTRVSM